MTYSTTTRTARVLDRIARVAAAPRVRADRIAREERERIERELEWNRFMATGQSYHWDTPFCHVCGRCTDHIGEHTDDQIRAWRENWHALRG